MTLQEVYDYLKTRCPNNIVRFGFHWDYMVKQEDGWINFDQMAENIKVSTMLGNLSHPIAAGYGPLEMYWPVRPYSFDVEQVTMDTLEEMGLKPNE